jgi:hypothetical protein
MYWRVSFYDRLSGTFFGRTWRSSVGVKCKNVKGTATVMAASEWTPVYFHSRITSDHVALVVECILAVEAPDGTPAGQPVGVGWALINAFGGEARSSPAPVPGNDDAIRRADAGLDSSKKHR